MTLETRRFVDIDDVKAFEIECTGCKVRTYYPTNGTKSVPGTCPHCNCDWFASLRMIDDALRNLRKALRLYKEDRKADAGMKFALELIPETQEKEKENAPKAEGERV